MTLYTLLFKHVLRRVPAEAAHFLGTTALRVLGWCPPALALVARRLAPRDPVLRVRALGLTIPSPLGVSAGMDKYATCFDGLSALGFGSVEVGTITARPQQGNEKPRVWRLLPDRGLLNAMGFPNPGAHVAADRLAKRRHGVVGVNVGKSKSTPLEDAADDYRVSVRALAPHADFVVLNVSSPNTPGLRSLQSTESLAQLVAAVNDELASIGLDRPVLIKVAPDLSDDELDAVADFAVASNVVGIVAVNTTISRDGLASYPSLPTDRGGVSGAPLKARALAVLERLHARVGSDLVLISVGGVETAQDVLDRILAGATLVQGHTGFVYGGPLWPKRLNDELAALVRARGAASISDLVGAGARRAAEVAT